MDENRISNAVIGACIELHKNLGPGLLESVYLISLAHDLRSLEFEVKTQVPMSLCYKDITHEVAYRLDMIVEDR